MKRIAKLLFSSLIITTGFIGISSACSISQDSPWIYTYADGASCEIPDAISIVHNIITKKEFYQAFVSDASPQADVKDLITDAQKAQYDMQFMWLIDTLWTSQKRNSSSKLAASLRALLPDMRAKYKDQSLSNDDKLRFGYLYFLTKASVEALDYAVSLNTSSNTLTAIPTVPTAQITNSNSDTLDFLRTYTALNGKIYTIWFGSSLYHFSRWATSWNSNVSPTDIKSSSLQNLINYLERQNRVLIMAPNRRMYAIWKYNNVFKINRDNWSVLEKDFATFDDAQFMIMTCAVNSQVSSQHRTMCGFERYGRE